jgi:hypothetical protein
MVFRKFCVLFTEFINICYIVSLYYSMKPVLFHAHLSVLTCKKVGLKCYVLNLINSFNETIFLIPLYVLLYQKHTLFSKRIFRKYILVTRTYI